MSGNDFFALPKWLRQFMLENGWYMWPNADLLLFRYCAARLP